MQEVIKKKLYEEQLVKDIAECAVIEALKQGITIDNVKIFIDQSIDHVIIQAVKHE